MSSRSDAQHRLAPRQWDRYGHVRELSLIYEGHSEVISVRPPDISPHGMFINTATHFPEGSVLRVRFRLTRSNFEVDARCEVRYCLPGVGIGIEFLEIPAEAVRAIEREIGVTSGRRSVRA